MMINTALEAIAPSMGNEAFRKLVKFYGSRTNRLREIVPGSVSGGIFDVFLRDNFRPEVDADVISGASRASLCDA